MNADDTFAAMLGLDPNKSTNHSTVLMSIDNFIKAVKDDVLTDDCGNAHWATETHHKYGYKHHYENGMAVSGSIESIDLVGIVNGTVKPPYWATHVLWIIWR